MNTADRRALRGLIDAVESLAARVAALERAAGISAGEAPADDSRERDGVTQDG